MLIIYIYFESLRNMCIEIVVELNGISMCKPNLAASYIISSHLQFWQLKDACRRHMDTTFVNVVDKRNSIIRDSLSSPVEVLKF